MNVVIIEDEPPAAEKLRGYLQRYDERIHVSAVLESVRESLVWFREHPAPDLVFSDIELLDGTVFPLYESGLVTCPAIFATAYDRFWMDAFENNGIAYLLKPYSFEKFAAAMRKFEELKRAFTPTPEFWRTTGEQLARPRRRERFMVRIRGAIHLVEAARVVFFQTRDEILFAHDAAGNRFPLTETLSQLEAELDPAAFFRINRSEIVNLNFIERLEPHAGDRLAVKLRHADALFITSASRTPAFRKWLEG